MAAPFSNFGQKPMADSYPISIANNQSPVPITGDPLSTPIPVTGTLSVGSDKNPDVVNATTSVTPNTETSLLISGKKSIQVTNRGSVLVKYAFAAGQSGVSYATLYPNGTYSKDGLSSSDDFTFYWQASKPSQRLEILTWA